MPIGSMYAMDGNMRGILMVNVTIYGIHGSYGMEIHGECPNHMIVSSWGDYYLP